MSTTPNTMTAREAVLLEALRQIVVETMAYPPVKPFSSDSYLPVRMIASAQYALSLYGALPIARVEVSA